ncbi:MAG: asparagine synthase B [Flavobacteriaceae bacterium]|jgi:asparagine synthase (glutamine-hydrolysing)|nr:asparagine synthase B [Flavobacteriaceae bacterium]MDO7581191.1 asparagine synthase B [Flavobacteriaceae bacterium]MDO7592324.1 asparagine synthase B [Flavobacteriaceae bacterium]MDO7599948.1 asparagine synthase B [Flavobacteriaceae bacterium]MDO7604091.1 asparagine synthase B [Flavobacteriaceae bacterium]|tara:strand:- start:345 stop:2009 length:1665 start_codon:yes stop_codon:yes gene_type:complete
MCGIVCAFELKQSPEELRTQVLGMSKSIRHRGPDWSGIFSNDKAVMAHERLAIVDPTSGKQPLLSSDGRYILAANGEIYNHKELRAQFEDTYDFQTASDCEIILALYEKKGPSFIDEMNGIFGFALYDTLKDEYFIARDHMGIIPLYMGWDHNGTFYVASELKALEGVCTKIELFPPGHYLVSGAQAPVQWYTRDWMDYDSVKDNQTSIEDLHDALAASVRRQLMSDVPYGVLLSGGLDSSVTSALAKLYAAKRIEADDDQDAWWPQLHSFAVGLEGSPDLEAASKVAKHIDTVHHEIKFTIQEGLDAIRDVVYHLETYDITTIRASTPMYLLARAIKALGIKMVLSGEGADELFGGYLYFHKAPNPRDFHEETVRKLDKLHQYDCLRANKSLAAWGIEGRVPFLDKDFMDVAMRINPADKMITADRMEKWVIRKAFEKYLPESVAWRQKEQFSDGVGYDWIDTLKEVVEQNVSDDQMQNAHFKFPVQTPQNKEEFYYRSIFEEHYPSETAALCVPSVPSVACSTPIALEWDEAFKNMNDPSGRAVSKVHDDAY